MELDSSHSPSSDSDEDTMSDEEAMEIYEDAPISTTPEAIAMMVPSSPNAASLVPAAELAAQGAAL